jgi:hypothetical protein
MIEPDLRSYVHNRLYLLDKYRPLRQDMPMRSPEKLCLMVALFAFKTLGQPPTTMTKIEVRLEGPHIPAGSFATKPKVMYRSGSQYCRIEEAPDPDNGIHGLMVINEPDAWMVNLMNKTAKHMVDPGPLLNCHLPIFPDTEKDLEFGFELEYFKSRGAVSQPGPVLQTKSTTLYKTDAAGTTLAIFTYGTPERPLAVSRVKGDQGEIFWFSGYGNLPFDPALFAKPGGVVIEEQKR